MKTCNKCCVSKELRNFESQRAVCRECRNKQKREYNTKNRNRINAYAKQYREENRELIAVREKTPERKEKIRLFRNTTEQKLRRKISLKKWRAVSKELCRAWDRRYRKKENRKSYLIQYIKENKQHIKARNKKWAQENKGIVNSATYRYRARKLKATPAWANHGKIKEIYKEAARLGMCVDHIIPLRNRLICGLHCEDNLQLLTPLENTRKGNSFAIC